MKTTVLTIWGSGMVSVADKYVQQALKLKEGLEIECKGATMNVSYNELKEKKPRSVAFRDKFRKQKMYQLYDFFWKAE